MELNPINMGLITIILILLVWLGYFWRLERKSSQAIKGVVSDVKHNLETQMKVYMDNSETITGLYLVSTAFSCTKYIPTVHIDYGINDEKWFFVIMLGKECEMITGPIRKAR